MTRGGAQFSTEELVRVISHYDIGVIEKVQALHGGSNRSPKRILASDKGIFLLKRRIKGRDDAAKIGFAHDVMEYLAKNNFPIAELISTNEGSKLLEIEGNAYEMFRYVPGERYNSKLKTIHNVGNKLGFFHKILKSYSGNCEYKSCFHDSETVRKNLTHAGENGANGDGSLKILSRDLMTFYNDSAYRVNELGFGNWSKQIIHGDWHPGNIIFNGSKIAAVIDFDSMKYGDPISDLANACLQFSIVAGRPNPKNWPNYLDEAKLQTMIRGYCTSNYIGADKKLMAIPDLMIETMIAEAILPIAATGYFAHFSGKEFLQMILRKADWISEKRNALRKLILSASSKAKAYSA